MLYSRNLDEHIGAVREQLVVTDNKVFNAKAKEFFKASIVPAREKLYLLTVACRLCIEAVIDRSNQVVDGTKPKYEKMLEYINVYLDGINIDSFHTIYDKETGTFGFTLSMYLDGIENIKYKMSHKCMFEDLDMLNVENVLEALMTYDDKELSNG